MTTDRKDIIRRLRDALLFDANHLVATGFSESGHEVRKHRALIDEADAFLASVEMVEPVAWRVGRMQKDGYDWPFIVQSEDVADDYREDGFTVIPLYTQPAPQESGGWVRVSERLPDIPRGADDIAVWTFDEQFVQRDRCLLMYDGSKRFARSPNVTHWRYAEQTPSPPTDTKD